MPQAAAVAARRLQRREWDRHSGLSKLIQGTDWKVCPTKARCAIARLDSLFQETIGPLSRYRVTCLLPMKLIQAQSAEEVRCARELFEEYAAWLGLNLCFQNFEKELNQDLLQCKL